MRVLTRLEDIDPDDWKDDRPGATCVTIGNFDGVHLGHQALLGQLVARARAEGGLAVAVTFDPHPVRFFRGDNQAPFLLTTTRQKMRVFEQLGIDLTVVLPFDARLASMEPEDFARSILTQRLRARYVLVGYDFAFGKGRSGGFDDLRRFGTAAGAFEAESFGPIQDAALPISSSRVRKAVQSGDMEEAARLLGRPFALEGVVVSGDARGREIGFPTANLEPEPELLQPELGIYVSTLVCEAIEPAQMPGVSSIGVRPTYYEDAASAPRVTETYVLQAPPQLDLYERRVELQLHRRLRPELKFESTGALVAQIERDVADARAWHGI